MAWVPESVQTGRRWLERGRNPVIAMTNLIADDNANDGSDRISRSSAYPRFGCSMVPVHFGLPHRQVQSFFSFGV